MDKFTSAVEQAMRQLIKDFNLQAPRMDVTVGSFYQPYKAKLTSGSPSVGTHKIKLVKQQPAYIRFEADLELGGPEFQVTSLTLMQALAFFKWAGFKQRSSPQAAGIFFKTVPLPDSPGDEVTM